MTILQINYFLAVAEYGSFTKAAQQIYVSQPTITQQVGALERELGLHLLERYSRKVELTPSGEVMADCFKRFREDFDESKKVADRFASGISGKLNIGFLTLTNMNPVMAKITDEFSGMDEVSVEIAGSGLNKLCTQLLSGKLDIAFFYDDQLEDHRDFRMDKIFSSEYKILISKSHPLAVKPDLTIDDLMDATFIVYFSGTVERHKNIYKKLGLSDVKVHHVSDYETIFTMVGSNYGVAVSDEHNTLIDKDLFYVIDTGLYHNMCAVRTKDHNAPLAEKLISTLSETFEQ
jgi:DNA-binding transcriptional LysR family regulator